VAVLERAMDEYAVVFDGVRGTALRSRRKRAWPLPQVLAFPIGQTLSAEKIGFVLVIGVSA
jgi:hypothetical protein